MYRRFTLISFLCILSFTTSVKPLAGDKGRHSIPGIPLQPTWEERIVSEGASKTEDFNVDFIRV